jgi:hypothetical protein
MRFTVLERDEFACQYCGAKAPDVILHVDHLVAVSKGGITSPENLITSCEACNIGKGGADLLYVPDHIIDRAGNAYMRGRAMKEAIFASRGERSIPAVPVDAPEDVVRQVESEGQALLISIQAANLSQDFVAGAVGRSKGLLSKWANDKRPIPNRFVDPLCAATGSNLLRQFIDLQRALERPDDVARLAEMLRESA